ncbi:MAG TPA: hypothetical protein VN923_05040, partial [Thermoanaerobaculia bacterium]|nr:hypothetical protein [Thermoanaerobaculia bacterium]
MVTPDLSALAKPARERSFVVGAGILAAGAALGAGLMYLFDPASGYRRRGTLRRLLAGTSGARDERGEGPSEASGILDRSRSLAAAVRARLHLHRDNGRTLEAKVRARLGRVATNPGAIA